MDRKLRKLKKVEILELLLEETRRTEKLESELLKCREKLTIREIDINEAGSLSEACMRLNGVFDAAGAACKQYEDNIKLLNERTEKLCAERISSVSKEIEARKQAAEQECADMMARTKDKADAYWDALYVRIETYMKSRSELQSMLEYFKDARS